MSEYLKPQSPLYHKKEDTYFYPLTTVDQVVLEDGSRLNSELSKHLMIDIKNANEAEPNSINADTLGGYAAEEYARKEDLENIDTGVSVDLLWENVNMLDEFAKQQIPLNLDGYYKIEILFDWCPDMYNQIGIPMRNILESTIYLIDKEGSAGICQAIRDPFESSPARSITLQKFDNIFILNIEDCFIFSNPNEVYNNYYLIPYRIYGYKGGNI